MMSVTRLDRLLRDSAARAPDAMALTEATAGGPSVTYGAFAAAVEDLAARLVGLGLQSGDRIGVHMRKSIASVTTLFAILEAGAAYVPMDATAPTARNAFIAEDCGLRLIVCDEELGPLLLAELDDRARLGPAVELAGGIGRVSVVASGHPGADVRPELPAGEQLAYILYTSGSTGKPKGVMHSHTSALAFVDWCSDVFEPQATDVFSSHAPFHFDLSILDLYVSLKHGARLVLIDEEVGKQPRQLAQVIAEQAISIWYSTPSILSLLRFYGKIERLDCSSLRIVLFAGEVFPLKNFKALFEVWPWPRYCNLYGPTETNVCTWHDLPRGKPVSDIPIGLVCAPDRALIVDLDDREVAPGEEGELLIAGGTVMKGYWNLPERSATSFFVAPDGGSYYRTGDVVRDRGDGCLVFVGRRDRMVKRRGYRVELGEIEAALCRNVNVFEAASVALKDADGAVHVRAFVVWRGETSPSLVEMKKFLIGELPSYMLPDSVVYLDALPKNSNDKIDYRSLQERT